MKDSSENIVLEFLQSLDFPGIRSCEGNREVCDYLTESGYKYTPDLVAGPPNIRDAQVEGLFFIDIVEPTTDLLFESKFYEGYSIDVPIEFKKILLRTTNSNDSFFIDSIPNVHQEFYLDSLNNKLDKYAHQRKFASGGKQLVSANFGMVHHFNLGELNENSLSDAKKLINLLDYIRFYKRLAPSDNIDLKNAENMILNEIINENQQEPYMLAVGRELADLPCLFFMIHIVVYKKSKRRNLALMILNVSHLENTDGLYPVHNWLKALVFHPRSVKYNNSEYKEKKIQISINSEAKLFQ